MPHRETRRVNLAKIIYGANYSSCCPRKKVTAAKRVHEVICNLFCSNSIYKMVSSRLQLSQRAEIKAQRVARTLLSSRARA